MAKIHGNKEVFGIVNCAAYNHKPEGDRYWYISKEARNAALSAMRERWVDCGLSKSAAQHGIYPIKSKFSALKIKADDVEVEDNGRISYI